MRVHITNLYGQASTSVALIAQNMVAKIAKELGYYEIGIYSYPIHVDSPSELAKRLDGMLAAVGNDDIVIIQSPSWNTTEFDSKFVDRLRLYSNLKIAIFIHDIVPLMFVPNEYLIEETIAIYNKADLLIVPSQSMLDELRRRGLRVEKIIIQGMWDHPTSLNLPEPSISSNIQFAGSPSRFRFIDNWTYPNKLLVYSDGEMSLDKNIEYLGWKDNVDLLQNLSQRGGFGLVWSEPGGVDGKYYEMNVSYKLSTYLVAGLPVIVQDTLSNHSIIAKNGLGLVVSSLEEANERLQSLTADDYKLFVQNVKKFRELLINGYFTKKLLIDSVFQLLQE